MAAKRVPLKSDQPKPQSAVIPLRWLTIGALLIAALPVGFLIAKKVRGSPSERGSRALVKAFSNRRLIEPRLAGFRGGEFRPPDGDDLSNIDESEFEEAQDLITDAIAKGELSAQFPYAQLLLSKGEKLNEALKYLHLTAANAPESAEPHNDLGACLMQQGKIEAAIEEFEAALKLKADMPEALFNRSLCYQRLVLRDAASEDLKRLLEIERDPSWRSEIDRRYQEMSSPLAGRRKEAVEAMHSALARQDTEAAKRIADLNFEEVLKHGRVEASTEYLKDAAEGNEEQAGRALYELKWMGRYLESYDDQSASVNAEYLSKLSKREVLAEFGLVSEYLKAERLFAEGRYSDARARFERLSKQFASHRNYLFEYNSATYMANCLYGEGQLTAGLQALNKVIDSVEARKWRFLMSTLLNQRGVVYSRLDQDSLAIKDLEQAKESGHGLVLVQAKGSQYLGNVYWRLGNLEKSLSELRESTRLYMASVPALNELANNYLQIADIYRTTGNHRLALLFAKQALDFSTRAKDYRRAAQAASFLAVEHAQLESWDDADEQLKRAFESIKQVNKDPGSYTELLVLSRSGQVASMRGETEAAVQYYSQAESLVGKLEDKTIPLLRILRGRSEVFARAKRFDEARKDLERAITLIEGYQAGIAGVQNRSAFLDASQGVFDQMILLNMGTFRRQPEAFALSEESRARVLLDQLTGNKQVAASGQPLSTHAKLASLADIQASLPEGSRLLTYSVTNERTYLFLITPSGFEARESPATTEMLDHLVFDYLSVLKNPAASDELAEQGRKLYDYLIRPIEGMLEDGKALCIVPDKALHFLPFAALVDGSGRYFVESHSLTYVPSASVLVRAVEEARTKRTSKDESIMAVGNPRFNPAEYPLLKNLPDAEREARESAAPYARRSIIIGPQASEREVRAQLRTCDVAHLAVHCLVPEKSPWLAALVLARPASDGQGHSGQVSKAGSETPGFGLQSSDTDGLLHLNEIYGLSLPRARLVVLSACESGLGQYYRGEGIVSLIRPFLAAQVPTVVASLWSVDSRATAELMIEFHRERKANNIGAGEALRTAQIKLIRSAEYQHPYYWAPFVSVGAN